MCGRFIPCSTSQKRGGYWRRLFLEYVPSLPVRVGEKSREKSKKRLAFPPRRSAFRWQEKRAWLPAPPNQAYLAPGAPQSGFFANTTSQALVYACCFPRLGGFSLRNSRLGRSFVEWGGGTTLFIFSFSFFEPSTPVRVDGRLDGFLVGSFPPWLMGTKGGVLFAVAGEGGCCWRAAEDFLEEAMMGVLCGVFFFWVPFQVVKRPLVMKGIASPRLILAQCVLSPSYTNWWFNFPSTNKKTRLVSFSREFIACLGSKFVRVESLWFVSVWRVLAIIGRG